MTLQNRVYIGNVDENQRAIYVEGRTHGDGTPFDVRMDEPFVFATKNFATAGYIHTIEKDYFTIRLNLGDYDEAPKVILPENICSISGERVNVALVVDRDAVEIVGREGK